MATNMIKLIKRKEQKSKVPLVIMKLLFTLFLSNLKITIIFYWLMFDVPLNMTIGQYRA